MTTYYRRPGRPTHTDIPVIIDVPPASLGLSRAHLMTVRNAATGEMIPAIMAMSLHANANGERGRDVWLVCEQLVDADGNPVKSGGTYKAESECDELFQPAVHTALFRYDVVGFTAGPAVDTAAKLHQAAIDAREADKDCDRTSVRVYIVRLKSIGTRRIAAAMWESRDGFVVFTTMNGARIAGYPYADVVAIDEDEDHTHLVLSRQDLETLRSAVAWDHERTAAAPDVTQYGARLAAVASLLGLQLPAAFAKSFFQQSAVTSSFTGPGSVTNAEWEYPCPPSS